MPDDYLSGGDYRNRLAARDALGQAIVKTMDENRLDAIAYPTTRRIAPRIGGNQIGTNAGLSAQTGLPAIAGVIRNACQRARGSCRLAAVRKTRSVA